MTGSAPAASARQSVADLSPDEFRRLGHHAVDLIADHLAALSGLPVAHAEDELGLRAQFDAAAPVQGADAEGLLDEAMGLLVDHSVFSTHPRFWAYISAAAAPLGALGDLIGAALNPNVAGWGVAPAATEIEAQTIRWIAEWIGYRPGCGGLMVSGGNAGNYVALLVARRVKADWDVRTEGLGSEGAKLRLYVSSEAHSWVQKAANMFGLGTQAIVSVPVDEAWQMRVDELERLIAEDRRAGLRPFLVVGTAGTVASGAIDPLPDIAEVCRGEDLWFHVDGAYGAPAALLPDAPTALSGIALADSVAVDPHKWLYAPFEAGCVLVREPALLRDTFRVGATYYGAHVDPAAALRTNYAEHGPQNSRGFRALKVWLTMRHAGRAGYEQMIGDDVRLSRELFQRAAEHPSLEAATQSLSIATFRYVPPDLSEKDAEIEGYLDRLNTEILNQIKSGGEAYLSQAVLGGTFFLRACTVNFRTSRADVEALIELVVRVGEEVDQKLRPTLGNDGVGGRA
jgi:glutamate/tyrosine decarboxylase-like PLP-dependent enzyme